MRSAGTPAITPGSPHSHIPVLGELGLVGGAEDAAAFVAARVAEGSDYRKIVVGAPAPSHDQATLDAPVAAARAHGKQTVAHASMYAAVEMAPRAGVDMLTHAPLDRALDAPVAARMVTDGRSIIPTLSMMEGVVALAGPPLHDMFVLPPKDSPTPSR